MPKVRAHHPKKNPIPVGAHPSLFERGETPMVVADWRALTKAELYRAAEAGQLSEDDINEIADEVSVELADELGSLAEEAQEARIDKFVEFFRKIGNGEVAEYNDSPKEEVVDFFAGELSSNVSEFAEEAREFLEEDGEEELSNAVSDEMLEEALDDLDLYDFEVNDDPDRRSDRAVWSYKIGTIESQFDGLGYLTDEGIDEAIKGLSTADLTKAANKLGNDPPYVRFPGLHWDYAKYNGYEPLTRKYFEGSFYITVGELEDARVEASIDMDKLVAKLRELVAEGRGEGTVARAPREDEVAHVYEGTDDSIAGRFARDMYVIRLRPDQLKAESAALKHCVGRSDMPYAQRARSGEIALYSIRDEENRPRFTIEERLRGVRGILQVKGKVNRLPGFEGGGSKLTRPDEVRYVVEFLVALGYTPAQISEFSDIRAGVAAFKEQGMDPFSPATRKNPRQKTHPKAGQRRNGMSAAEMAAEDYEHPWGGSWGA
jgi:hypothetical protein